MTKTLRDDIKKNKEAFEKANETDSLLLSRLAEGKVIVEILRKSQDEVAALFAVQISSGLTGSGNATVPAKSLIDDLGGIENGGLGALGEQVIVEKLDGMLSRLRAIKKERQDVIDDLKKRV